MEFLKCKIIRSQLCVLLKPCIISAFKHKNTPWHHVHLNYASNCPTLVCRIGGHNVPEILKPFYRAFSSSQTPLLDF